MKGSLLLTSSVAFKDTREKAEKLSCIIPCCTNSYLLLGTAQLAVAAASVAKGAAVFRASAPRGWQKELCNSDCVTLGTPDHGTSLSLSAKLLSPKFHQAHAGGCFFGLFGF